MTFGGIVIKTSDSTHGLTAEITPCLWPDLIGFIVSNIRLMLLRAVLFFPVGISHRSLVQASIFIKDGKCNSAYWHFNVGLLSDTVFKGAFKCFWRIFRETKSEYSSLQQWWDVGKGKIKELCLQYTFNATKVMTRSVEALEREIVELQSLADST